jgi:hypothetical protein
MFDEVDALTIDKTAMDRTQRTREPEQRKSETFLNDHPKDALMFHGNVLFLPLVLWCSVFYCWIQVESRFFLSLKR